MGATSRLLMLLSTSFPRPSSPLRLALRHFSALPSLPTLKPRRRLLLLPSIRASHDFHSHPAVHNHDASRAWPEWSRFLEHVTSGGYAHSGDGGDGVDAFDESLEVQDEFARGVRACLSFAYNRPTLLKLLPEKDIRVVVNNASPFLFKNCSETVQRMSFFLNPVGGSVDKGQTADLVRYLTSYAYSQLFFSREIGANATGFVEASVCNLLNEMVSLSGPVQKSYFRESNSRKNFSTFENSPRSRSNIEKKRGDWICPKCSFLNFARNMNCLECNELRPKRQLTGGEWECPKCYFYNYGRNMACLKCDCERPGDSFSPDTASESRSENTIFSAGQAVGANNSITRNLDRILGKTSNVSVADNNGSRQVYVGRRGESTPSEGRNSDYVPFVPLPADMFKAPNVSNLEDQPCSPSVVSQTEVLADIGYQESSDPYKRTSAVNDVGMPATSISDDFPDIMPLRKGENRFVVSKKKDRSLTSPQYKRRLAMEQANDSNFVPFVPFPPGYFAKKDNLIETGSPAMKADPLSTDTAFSANPKNGPEQSDEIRSSKWMPSENPQSSQQNGNTESSTRNWYVDKLDPRNSGEYAGSSDNSDSQKNAAQQNWENRFSQGAAPSRTDVSWNSKQPSYDNPKQNQGNDQNSNFFENSRGSHYKGMDLSPSNKTNRSLGDRKIDGQNSGYSSWGDYNETDRGGSSASQSVTNLGTGESSGWKSLEGSAVTEPDPLDMSEEAKAQRWFRRVAQITDISELANIPDEDFPQIMPMRKGVNRFVVSKRKTPLERRLTSPQYRRNLPIVSSEPENDSSNQTKT